MLSNSRPLHDKAIDDGKEKTQIIKFHDFAKGGTDIVHQLNTTTQPNQSFAVGF